MSYPDQYVAAVESLRARLELLEWRRLADAEPGPDEGDVYGDVEWSDGKSIWQGQWNKPTTATHWRPIILPKP